MSETFGRAYAGTYDLLYEDKDYRGDVANITATLANCGREGPARILDLGCGSGRHAWLLAEQGHRVVGVDRSEAMLEQARAAAALHPAAPQPPRFLPGDLRSVDLRESFDVALMMFAVLGYQRTNEDLLAALATVRRHLVPGGLFIFDVWNGPGVLADPPGPRVRSVVRDDTRILRLTEAKLDQVRQCCHVFFDVLRLERDQLVEEVREEHVMRYFFPQELALALQVSHLRLRSLLRLPDLQGPADGTAWNVLGVAEAVAP